MDGVTVIANPGSAHQVRHQDLLAQGLAAHGIATRFQHDSRGATTKRVACWGWRIGRLLRAAGHDVLVMERGYIGDRFAWTSLGWNGLNGRAQVPAVPDDGGARLRRFHPDALQPAASGGDYALLVGQVPGDAALNGRDLHPWYCEQAACDWQAPVRFRPHPLAGRRGPIKPVPGAPLLEGSLADALSAAAIVVTYNSNVGVDAKLAGRPVWAADCGSMIFSEGRDRDEWAARLAWRQWLPGEISSGFALQHVGVTAPQEASDAGAA